MWRGGDNTRGAVTGQRFDPAYYTEQRYLMEYDLDALSLVRTMLDADLRAGLGYEL